MIRRSGALALLLAVAACAPALGAPVKVNVRIEGAKKTLFEGTVKTDVRTVDSGDGTGPHKCDGTNQQANPNPGPTLLGAFADALDKAKLTWAGKYSQTFEDFTIDRVGPDSNDTTNGRYWGQVLNYKDTQVGGCAQRIVTGDHVLVAFNSYGHPHLKLTGPKKVKTGKSFKVKVVDGRFGNPFKGAKVGGKTTDSKGRVTLKRKHAGVVKLKASAPDAVRSNRLKVKVRAAH